MAGAGPRRRSWPAEAAVLIAGALAGAAGLGLEGVLLSAAGLALGVSRGSALGLGAFIAGWALGAFVVGRSRGLPRRVLVWTGVLLVATGVACARLLFLVGRERPGSAWASGVGLLAVFAAAVPQGMLLVGLARVRASIAPRSDASRLGLAPLWAANLLGSVAGASLFGFTAVAAFGRLHAAQLAALCGLVAALLGALAARRASRPDPGEPLRAPPEGALSIPRAGWIVGVATLWCTGLEWIALRLLVLWLGSSQTTLTAVLAASLLSLAVGALLWPAVLPRGRAGIAIALLLALAGSSWIFAAAPALRAVADQPPLVSAFVLCGPMLSAFGALVPMLHRECAGESGARLGSLLLHEAWGGLAAGPLAHWVLVPRFGLGGAVAALALCAGIAALALAPRARSAYAVLAAAVAVCALGARLSEPALQTPQLRDPALQVRAFAEDSEFAVSVVDDGLIGERTLLTDQFRAAGTGRDYLYMRVLGHLPLLLHPAPRRVAVMCLGTGTTCGAVALHPEPERIEVLEISRAVVEQASWFEAVNQGALAEGLPRLLDSGDGRERVVVRLGDGRRTLAEAPGAFDVVTMEPLLPDSPFGVYLYTREFYGVARRSLAPGGLLCQWVPPHALTPGSFDAVVSAFTSSFRWSSLWLFGTQLLMLGGAAAPNLDPARFASAQATPRLRDALAQLGLDTPEGLLARFVADGSEFPPSGRELTDVDPWIAFAAKPRDLRVLEWLPGNLERLLQLGGAPPAWIPATSSSRDRSEALAALRAGRVAHARAESEYRRGRRTAAQVTQAARPELARARALAPNDPEVLGFAEELEFLDELRQGVAGLQSGLDDESAAQHLLTAAQRRPERADVHLYLAVALRRVSMPGGTAASEAARNRALELCPRILETPAGERARQLGL
jgi:spermidine synthase